MKDFPRLKHDKLPVSDRLRRSVDPSQLGANREALRDLIALSLSTPLMEGSRDDSFANLRASAPAKFVSTERVDPQAAKNLVVPLDTQDLQIWQEVFSNRVVGGKALVTSL